MSASGSDTRRHWSSVSLAAVVCSLLFASFAEAARVRSLGLADMAGRAGRIFVGRCTARTVAGDPQTLLPITTYVFTVTEPIKGVGRGPTTFRLPGTPDRPLLPGLPVFQVGDEALLLLYPESPAGFSSAIGLDQGRFRLLRAADGSARAINGTGNERLLKDVPASILSSNGLVREPRGPMDLSKLLEVLRVLASKGEP